MPMITILIKFSLTNYQFGTDGEAAA
jgi:hypothetical protein